MIKLLIVDDEVETRTVIREMIPWEENGITVCAEAANGKDTISFIESEKPEIILLDIRMPIIDGLEVAKYINSNHPDTEIIILSGYDEFAYAQKAIKYGVSDYLLKPCRPEDILNSVLKSKNKLNLYKNSLSGNSSSFNELYDTDFFKGISGKYDFDKVKNPKDIPYINTSENEKIIIEAVEAGKVSSVVSLVEGFFSLFENHLCTKSNVINSCLTLIAGVHQVYKKYGISAPEDLEKNLIYQNLNEVKTIQQLKQTVLSLAREAAETIYSKSNSNSIINTAIKYIDEHYSDNITLNSLADFVHITPSYLSLIFKKVQGINFIDYLNKIRIQNSIKLMKDINLRTYEIAFMVGYSDEKYFSRMFKRITGYNPSTYRKLVI